MAHGWWKISSARAALEWPRKTARSLALEDAFAGRCRATPGALKDFSGQIRALGNTGGSRGLLERSPAPSYFWNLGQRGGGPQPPAQAGKSFSFSSPPPAEGCARPFARLRAAIRCLLRELVKSCAGRQRPPEGTLCSGITHAQHAGGPWLNPQRVHAYTEKSKFKVA